MLRQETDREDLLAEATALVRRAELTGPLFDKPIIAGFKRDGSLSVYFGGDPVYHFDSQGRLKRAYVGGKLYRTQGETLAELTRERTPSATLLHRRDLPKQECDAFLHDMRHRLACLSCQIDRGKATVVRQVPPGDRTFVECELVDALHGPAGIDEAFADFLAPRFKGKR